MEKAQKDVKDSYLAMVWLCDELKCAAEKGNVIKLNGAWDRYCTLAEKAAIEIPPSYTSRRTTSKQKVMHKVGNIIECMQSLERGPFEHHTLLIPSKLTNVAVSRLVSETSAETDSSLTVPIYEPTEDIFLSLVHIALKIRTDIV